MSSITVTAEDLVRAVQALVEKVLTPEVLNVMAEKRIDERIGFVSLDEAQRRFAKPNRRSLNSFLRENRIRVVGFNRKNQFIRIAEVERVLEKCEFTMTPRGEVTATRIG